MITKKLGRVKVITKERQGFEFERKWFDELVEHEFRKVKKGA